MVGHKVTNKKSKNENLGYNYNKESLHGDKQTTHGNRKQKSRIEGAKSRVYKGR